MKKLLCAALALAATTALAQTRWDLPSGYNANTFQVQNLQWFAAEAEKASAGKLKIQVHPGASLFKANEIKRAVQSGQTAIGEFILSSAANENPLFGVDSIPFLATSYDESRRLDEVSRPGLEKVLREQGLKLLYTVPWPPQGLYTAKPVASMSDLKGTKMRAYNPATARIAEIVGAQPVTIQLAELPQGLATGTVQNFLTSSASGVDSKLYEHVKYFYDVNAWLPRNAVVVNQRAFDGLDKATQDAVLKVAADAARRGWQLSEQKDAEYMKELAAKGMTVDLTSEGLKRELKTIGQRMSAEWLQTAGEDGQRVLSAFSAAARK
ncbi:TRAP transporter substrate-binding protein [Aquabacterium sp. J223]|uniref:TRAP transporter substrate-binding protein n=1 Tax=Aquabacterium sp. J223 TaxID=2898431 RepID=UPI0021AE279A|nr:TRAP transporter substrate-binding protein [Aquabacterium sp. J223]UUX97144.1 TRAP transporter substrate-binding protein [Aquabacterium sp. J223]